jgi:hypothetical protein
MTAIAAEDGVLFRGQRYRSLSASRAGYYRWSGPLFFDLKSAARSMTMERARPAVRRCAIYARKSPEEGAAGAGLRYHRG